MTKTSLNICGNGWFEGIFDEQCDDGNIAQGDGCSPNCMIEDGFECTGGYGKVSSCTRK